MITEKKEVRKMFTLVQKLLDKYPTDRNLKLLKVGTVEWENRITKKIEKVDDIWVLGLRSSSRPIIVTAIEIETPTKHAVWRLTDRIHHANLSYDIGYRQIANFKGVKIRGLEKDFELTLKGQEFCNPLTALHVLETEHAENLIKGHLMEQNFDDAYMEVYSVSNASTDEPIRCQKTGKYILPSASPLELILKMDAIELNNLDNLELNERLTEMLRIKKDEFYVKLKSNSGYMLVDNFNRSYYKKNYSELYPIFSYEDIKNLKIEVPKKQFDIGVYGLGSAGTAILDQLCRSNWIKTFYLCDFDSIERKNMRNQWYIRKQNYSNKVDASVEIIEQLGVSEERNIIRFDRRKFQDTKLDDKVFKYLVSGFDSIEARLDFLKEIKDGKLVADYLIDCRYLDLACSIYFIDLNNKEELEFYEANLIEDGELLKKKLEKETLSLEDFCEWFRRKDGFKSECEYIRDNYFGRSGTCEPRIIESCHSCGSEQCQKYLYGLYKASLPNPRITIHENSCIKYNLIDIYKFVGSIVFGAVRKIENDEEKPFSLVEAQTDINGLPNLMKVR